MSHIAAMKTERGKPVFSDVNALRQAATMLGCELVEQKTYHWFGRSVGDYPVPEGMKANELGKNATFVIRLTAETKQKNKTPQPYEVGICEDINNPGCFLPVYDFWCGGFGIDQALGAPVYDAQNNVQTLLPKLLQHYHMVCTALAAQEAGDHVEFMTFAQAHLKHPDIVPANTDETTWISLVDTQQRLGVS